MPTKHRRIAVTRDDELEGALRRAAPVLGEDKPAATLVRELALRGAEAVAEESPEDELRRHLVEKHGARLGKGSFSEFLKERGDLGPPDPERRASKILEELREETLP